MTTNEKPASRLRKLLQDPGILVAPGAYDCLTARIIQQAGFPAVYMTGAGTSIAALGYPDLGLATMTEMVGNAAGIVEAVEVPVIADADTGYGGVLNVQRTVRQYEKAGVAAIHIEDQIYPKRASYHKGLERIVPMEEFIEKMRHALEARRDEDFVIIGRTDVQGRRLKDVFLGFAPRAARGVRPETHCNVVASSFQLPKQSVGNILNHPGSTWSSNKDFEI